MGRRLLKTFTNFLCAHAGDANHLTTGGRAGGYGNRGTRYIQHFRQKLSAGTVGATFEWGRGQGYLQSVPDNPRDGIPFCPRLHFDGKAGAVGSVVDRNHVDRLAQSI